DEVRQPAEADEWRFRTLVEHIPMVVSYVDRVIVDNPGHSLPLYISPQIEDLLGYPTEEWLSEGELWLRVLHPDDKEWMREEDERARRHLTPLSAEYRMVSRDGAVVWVSEKAAVITDPRTGTRYWQGVMVDITERKHAEEKVEALLENEQVRQRERAMLLDRTLRADEAERIRLAAEIHDGPVQRVARMVYVLERIRTKLDRGELEDVRGFLLDLQNGVMQEVHQLRETMVRLRPPVLDEL